MPNDIFDALAKHIDAIQKEEQLTIGASRCAEEGVHQWTSFGGRNANCGHPDYQIRYA